MHSARSRNYAGVSAVAANSSINARIDMFLASTRAASLSRVSAPILIVVSTRRAHRQEYPEGRTRPPPLFTVVAGLTGRTW